MPNIKWSVPPTAVFLVVFGACAALVSLGKMSPDVLLALLAYLAPPPYRTGARMPHDGTPSGGDSSGRRD